MKNRVISRLTAASALVLSFISLALPGVKAQQVSRSPETFVVKPTPPAASAPTAVPALIPYSGTGAGADGKPFTGEVPVTFLVYKDETGGEPVFTESQVAAFDSVGHYEVQLGATLSNGIPIDLFGSGEARWLEVQIAGARIAPRVLMASVPYALKAGDASTLGGLPASAYVLAGSGKIQATTNILPVADGPNTVFNVTTTGGTSGYLPVFNGGATVVNSTIFQSSTGIGIGDTPNANYKLDVNGKTILRGLTSLPSNGLGTSSAGTDSFALMFSASAYNSSVKADDTPVFSLQAEPTGNNTTAPAATFNLLYNANSGAGAETGLYFNPNGTIHFASAQTFSATGSAVAFNGSSTSGLGVEGTSSSSSGVQGSSTSSNGVYGKSSTGDGLQGLTAGTNLKTAGVLGVAGTGNTSSFTGIAGVWGDANAHVGVLGTSTQYSGVQGASFNSYGVQGTSTDSYGVSGTTAYGPAGVYGYSSSSSYGVIGTSANGGGAEFEGGVGNSGSDGYGADGVLSYGGESDPNETAGAGGSGVTAYGGYGASFSGGFGVLADGGNSNTGYGGDGLYAYPGNSQANGTTGAYAANFEGSIKINGTVHSDVITTEIDHPLDPANRYLNQASIESSEMVNLYSGNATTDERGLATIQLPPWFASVNSDLRYQLTTIGKKAQAWISEEFKDGKFQIASDAANVKVSWLITGLRQDAYAKAHPLVVEQEKDARERGFYKHPELYGQPAEKQTEWGRQPGMMRARQHAAAVKTHASIQHPQSSK